MDDWMPEATVPLPRPSAPAAGNLTLASVTKAIADVKALVPTRPKVDVQRHKLLVHDSLAKDVVTRIDLRGSDGKHWGFGFGDKFDILVGVHPDAHAWLRKQKLTDHQILVEAEHLFLARRLTTGAVTIPTTDAEREEFFRDLCR